VGEFTFKLPLNIDPLFVVTAGGDMWTESFTSSPFMWYAGSTNDQSDQVSHQR
jgi:hypothetical protein